MRPTNRHSIRRRVLVIVAVLATATGAIATRPLVANAGQPTAAKPPTFPPDFFGISTGADLTNETPEVFDAEMNIMKAAGADWVRADIPWGLVEHNSASDANWLLIDRIVNMVQAEGMKLEAIIGAPPLWAYDNPPPVADCTTQAEFDVFAYANFAAEVAQRYGSARVPVIELENAPNLPGPHSDWHTANACAYTRLMQASYTAIKNVDPNITVLTGGLGAQNNSRGGISGDAFLAQMYQYGAQGSFDAVSWHPYSYPCFPSMSCKKPRPWYRTDTVRQLMIDNGDSAKLIWSTEYGAPTKGAPDDGHVDQNNQAAMMVNAMQTWMALPYAGPLFVFELRDTGGSTKHKDNWFGMISHDGTKRKLSYYAFQYEAKGHTSVKLPANVIAGTPGP